METNIIFQNVKAYNVTKFDVRLNEDFKIELTNIEQPIRWFANNDTVLQIITNEDGLSSQVKATGKGVSEIQLQNAQNQIQKILFVEVYDQIAVSLNLSAGEPVLK
jgi:membrane carboxypeptidase/penicillin-binding protein PbpC